MKQRKTPCKECPFRRDNNLTTPNPGGSSVKTYVGQVQGPFWLPCHMEKEYNGKETEPKAVSQCAGAAIYRSNVKNPYKLPEQLLSLPEDHELVFSSHAEFIAHYRKKPIEQVDHLIKSNDLLQKYLLHELNQAKVKKIEL
jgi:hypothetical protein